jgi:NADPH:quinone reductase-like Zn-dependent oxidoreductase
MEVATDENTKKMKCILVSAHGTDIDNLLTLSMEFPKPVRKKGEVLIQVQACALAPGDIRVMKGHCDYFQAPRGFPYVPGGDVSGIVEEADEESRFKKGDAVLAMFEIPRPLDGLAEYTCVKEGLVECYQPNNTNIRPTEAACLTSSALAAWRAVQPNVKSGDRVLVLGASGGVGTFLVQLARNAGADYIAATSTAAKLLESLGVDRVINYNEEDWWDVSEFQATPFDVVFDLGVGKKEAWIKAKTSKVLKSGWNGGRYVTFSGDDPEMKIHNLWQTLTFVAQMYRRVLWTNLFWKFEPRYIIISDVLNATPGVFSQLTQLVADGKLKVILDRRSPFTLEAVKRGFHLMNARHAHGKVVIEISSSPLLSEKSID